jgi:hypothetical protein
METSKRQRGTAIRSQLALCRRLASHVAIPDAELTQVIIVGVGVLVEQGRSWQAFADFHRYFPAAMRCARAPDTVRARAGSCTAPTPMPRERSRSACTPAMSGERAHMCGRSYPSDPDLPLSTTTDILTEVAQAVPQGREAHRADTLCRLLLRCNTQSSGVPLSTLPSGFAVSLWRD